MGCHIAEVKLTEYRVEVCEAGGSCIVRVWPKTGGALRLRLAVDYDDGSYGITLDGGVPCVSTGETS